MENRYYTSFWNYVKTGTLDNSDAANDWKKMGINLPMSWEYIDGESDKKIFLEMLDECQKHGMKVIICDSRTRWEQLTEKGIVEFEEGVKRAAEDFATHPAAFGFHIGDEPNKSQMPDMIEAYKIVKKAAPHLTPFVNFLPYWEDYSDPDAFNEHVEYMCGVAKEAGLEMVCYDYYGQMASNESGRLIDLYFKNLNLFRIVAERNHIPLWTTLLSTAHYNSKTITEDDVMWQIATATAHGCKGIFWFYVYFRNLINGSYRNYPISNFSEEKEYGDMFYYLSRQNRIFLKHYASRLEGYNLSAVRHYNVSYGFTKLFKKGEFEIEDVNIIVNKEAPLIISRFINGEGKVKYVVVNNDREKSVKLKFAYKGGYSDAEVNKMQAPDLWVAAGQMSVIDIL